MPATTASTERSRTSTSLVRSCGSASASGRGARRDADLRRARHVQRAAPHGARRRRGRDDLVPARGELRARRGARRRRPRTRRPARSCDRPRSTASTSSSSTRTARSSSSTRCGAAGRSPSPTVCAVATGRPVDEPLFAMLGYDPASGEVRARRRPGRDADGAPARPDPRRARSSDRCPSADAADGRSRRPGTRRTRSGWRARWRTCRPCSSRSVPAAGTSPSRRPTTASPTDATLAALGIAERDRRVRLRRRRRRVKPAPGHGPLPVSRGLASRRRRTAVVGDSAADLLMARAAGAGLAIGVLTGVGGRADLEPLADEVIESVGGSGRVVRADDRAPESGQSGVADAVPIDLVPMGYRREHGPPSTVVRHPTVRRRATGTPSGRSPHPMVVARQRPVNDPRRTPIADRPDAGRPRCAGSRPRSAAASDLDGLFQRRHRRGLHPVRRRPGRAVDVRRTGRRRSASSPQRGLSREILEIIATLPRDAQTAGMAALRDREVRVLGGDLETTLPEGPGRSTVAPGSGRSASSRSCSATSPLGLLVLYHRRDYAWTADETRARARLRRPHGDRHRQRPAGRHDQDA